MLYNVMAEVFILEPGASDEEVKKFCEAYDATIEGPDDARCILVPCFNSFGLEAGDGFHLLRDGVVVVEIGNARITYSHPEWLDGVNATPAV
jgi:hypothetical protein